MKRFSKMLKLISASILVFGGLSFLSANALEEFNQNASQEVKELVTNNKLSVVDYEYVLKAIGDGTRKNANSLIIDVRPLKKYQMAHIPSSLILPDSKFDQMYDELLGKIEKNKEIILYCGGFECTKSPQVAVMLAKKGHTNIKVYAAGMPQWQKKNYVEIDTNVAKALFDNKSALFIDARPYGKFAGSTIIGSLGVPDTKFEEYVQFMPNDKNAIIITFCGGYDCHKSHSVADKLVKLGYTNVKVYAAGFPEWKKENLPVTGAASQNNANAAPKVLGMSDSGVLQKGADSGTVDGKWFVENYKNLPKSVTLVDVRSPKDYNNGHIAGSINIHAEKMTPQQLLQAIPKTGDVVFLCGTGTRAMEARGFLAEDLKYEGINRIWYFDANISCNKNNECTIEPNEPLGI